MDAGGPSAEPPAEGEIKPVDWKAPQNVYQAKQKLEYLNCMILVAQAALDTKVGSVHQPFVCQGSAVMCVILGDVSGLTPSGWTLHRGSPGAISLTFASESVMSRNLSISWKREQMRIGVRTLTRRR